ncbi:hypothetical protein D9757_005026 [Collybiopsis confluens]|uniref:Uncharacterized protein n=1 Tax=Collybiopsis confluens TaxID=2823264 RepID=A0A8H5HTG4_9AGAR|nr:hypothetical protein D9757_005026 [Collybiopsis confluens]
MFNFTLSDKFGFQRSEFERLGHAAPLLMSRKSEISCEVNGLVKNKAFFLGGAWALLVQQVWHLHPTDPRLQINVFVAPVSLASPPTLIPLYNDPTSVIFLFYHRPPPT